MKLAKHVFVLLFFSHMNGYSQDLSTHQWKDRVLIILTDSPANTTLRKQLNELRKHEEGLAARQLIVYQSLPTKYGVGLDYPTSWKYSSDLYTTFNDEKRGFKVVLIGLDGTVKLTHESLLSA